MHRRRDGVHPYSVQEFRRIDVLFNVQYYFVYPHIKFGSQADKILLVNPGFTIDGVLPIILASFRKLCFFA